MRVKMEKYGNILLHYECVCDLALKHVIQLGCSTLLRPGLVCGHGLVAAWAWFGCGVGVFWLRRGNGLVAVWAWFGCSTWARLGYDMLSRLLRLILRLSYISECLRVHLFSVAEKARRFCLVLQLVANIWLCF